MATTPILGLPFPDEYDPADVPSDIEKLAMELDRSSRMFLPGDYKVTAALEPPPGWLLCDGRAVSRTVYAALFAAIQETHGAGDGETTFNLPNFIDRVPMAVPSARLGERGGAASVALTLAQLASHAHGGQTAGNNIGLDHLHGISYSAPSPVGITIPGGGSVFIGTYDYWNPASSTGAADRSLSHVHAIGAEGGNQAHENRQPYVGVNVFIKT
jgi:microcystin-dependent protein